MFGIYKRGGVLTRNLPALALRGSDFLPGHYSPAGVADRPPTPGRRDHAADRRRRRAQARYGPVSSCRERRTIAIVARSAGRTEADAEELKIVVIFAQRRGNCNDGCIGRLGAPLPTKMGAIASPGPVPEYSYRLQVRLACLTFRISFWCAETRAAMGQASSERSVWEDSYIPNFWRCTGVQNSLSGLLCGIFCGLAWSSLALLRTTVAMRGPTLGRAAWSAEREDRTDQNCGLRVVQEAGTLGTEITGDRLPLRLQNRCPRPGQRKLSTMRLVRPRRADGRFR